VALSTARYWRQSQKLGPEQIDFSQGQNYGSVDDRPVANHYVDESKLSASKNRGVVNTVFRFGLFGDPAGKLRPFGAKLVINEGFDILHESVYVSQFWDPAFI